MLDVDSLHNEVARILSENVVDVVLGFKNDSLPMHTQPVFISRPADAKSLVLNGFCASNLAALLKQRVKIEKIGVICRGCESRAIHALTVEHQVIRENLFLIGVSCEGILDWRAISRAVGMEILNAVEDGQNLQIICADGEHQLARPEFIHSACRQCQWHNPIGVDIEIGEFSPNPEPANLPSVATDFAAQSTEDRYAFFKNETDRCIRCYACREACPMCYCTECFVDHITPRWCESMISPGGTQAWHIIRAFHQTGRCISCGACERACPMEIKMEYITDKLNQDMKDMYGFEVGANDTDQPPFAAFSLDDRDRFIE